MNPSSSIPAGSSAAAGASTVPAAAPAPVPSAPPAARRAHVDGGTAGGLPGGSAPPRPGASRSAADAPTHAPAHAVPIGGPRDAIAEMMVMQRTLSLLGAQAQATSAELHMKGQQVGALSALALQTVTDQARSAKDSVKAQGQAFGKAD